MPLALPLGELSAQPTERELSAFLNFSQYKFLQKWSADLSGRQNAFRFCDFITVFYFVLDYNALVS